MADVQVDCIQRDGPDSDYRIDRLGGPQPTGQGRWNEPIDKVIQYIQTGQHRFWTSVAGQSVWIVVRQHPRSGRLYLATENDGFPPNNLLSLRECP